MEQMNYNLLFRWFVGLEMDDAVWDVTVFTKNRERLIARGDQVRSYWSRYWLRRGRTIWLSEEHFTVDGTLLQAWAAARSFKEKSDQPKPGSGSGYKGAKFFCATRWSRRRIPTRVCIRKPRRTSRFLPIRATH